MKLSALHLRATKSAVSRRRGILAAWTIWIMLASCVIVGGVFNVIWRSGIRSQARNCAASAAFAAGHSYFSDDMLRSWQQPFEYEGRVDRCRQAAISMVERYRNGTTLPSISKHNVLVDWAEAQSTGNDPALLVPLSISVSFDRNRESVWIPAFFGGLAEHQESQHQVLASVTLEHAPRAFCPAPNASIPMLPFTICDEVIPSDDDPTGPAGSGYWTRNIESGKGQDNFSWDHQSRRFERGPDGLPELTVTIHSTPASDSPDAFIPLNFRATSSQAAGSLMEEWILKGLTFEDLQTHGKREVSFPGDFPVGSLTKQDLHGCMSALQKKLGEPCLICLSSTTVSSGGMSSLTLKRPVAARLIQATQGAADSLRVTLQPCVIVTATAVTATGSDTAINRYVYSVRMIN